MSGFDLDLFKSNLNLEKNSIEELILKGGCQDFASYRQKVGERRGILIAVNQITETLKQMGNDDE